MADEPTNESNELQGLAETLLHALEQTIESTLKDATNDVQEKAAAILEACTVVAVRASVKIGCPWREAIWAIRATAASVEEAHIEMIRAEMATKVGAPRPGEENTAVEETEKSLIEMGTAYTPRSEG